ncbi:hypothetical protein CLOSTASPAR_03553 [[Clostridium] asparagiforme DSM 15981]|uniref:Uncharacterized protein n=1 Tax=[Clostridium] asparagiforme DSM 15981 TaxID=518636 RepID=C0D2R4_9FIRM|nr:hypothetical protein CLOSTASPAR_03553 [[Clostridium] asparagiforme DSM 15981]
MRVLFEHEAIGHILTAFTLPLPLDVFHIVHGAFNPLRQTEVSHLLALFIGQGNLFFLLSRQPLIDVEALGSIAITADVVLKFQFAQCKTPFLNECPDAQGTPGH